jgi:hypothetical protein
MPRGRGKSKENESKGGDGSRQKDRDDEPVVFENGDPVYVQKDANNFVSIDRTVVVGKNSGETKNEFVRIQQGFYGGDGKDKPFYPRKENMKWPSVQPSLVADLIFALEEVLTDDEYDDYEKRREEE